MTAKKRWYIAVGLNDGEIYVNQLIDGLVVGLGISEKTAIAKEARWDQPVQILVVCSDTQGKLLDALDAMNEFSGLSANNFLFGLTDLIRASRNLPGISVDPADRGDLPSAPGD